MAKSNQKAGNGIGHKGGSQGSGKDGDAKKILRAQAEAAVIAAKRAENARKAAAKAAAPKPKIFTEIWQVLPEFQTEYGQYRIGGEVGHVSIAFYQDSNTGKELIKVISSDCCIEPGLFLGFELVQRYSAEQFSPNHFLPEVVQAQQKKLHAMMRTAFEKVAPAKAKLSLVPKGEWNKFAGFAREEKTCSDIRQLVLGRVQVYRIADANGKYVVLSCTSEGTKPSQVVYVTLKYMEAGHELDGKVQLGIHVKLYNLQKESFGIPFGEHAQQMREAGVLHAWLRNRAMAAGLKDKKSVAQRKAA